MELAKVTSKGQVTIPVAIRKLLGIQEGDKILFVEEGEKVVMMNAFTNALLKVQKAFEGIAEEPGIQSEQKAREGKWNGGFAPYGYKLENGQMLIAEDEVEVIRMIYDRYIHTNEGINGVAKYLNTHGYTKKLRKFPWKMRQLLTAVSR